VIKRRFFLIFAIMIGLLGYGHFGLLYAQEGVRVLRLDPTIEQELERAVVYISVEYTKPNSLSRNEESGTGFFVTPSHIVTGQHVIASALKYKEANLKIRLFSGTPQSRLVSARIVNADARLDLALLALEENVSSLTPLRIHPQLPNKQAEIFALGFPLGAMLDRSLYGPNVCIRRGYVSRLINDGRHIEADLNIDKGISGGPLVDEQGYVRGVISAMAGSFYNRNYAAIAVSSLALLEFCRHSGIPVLLPDGQILEPHGSPLSSSLPSGEPSSRPRVSLNEDALRAYFALGSSLRLSAIVPAVLYLEKASYTPDLRQSSRNNADLVLANLQRLQAPVSLIRQAEELARLFNEAAIQPAIVKEKASALEKACDEWMLAVSDEEKLNYDLGAWLTELSLGLLDSENKRDSQYCAFFVEQAQAREATPEIIQLLLRLQTNLQLYEQKPNDALRRAIAKDADRLIGIGYLATKSSGRNPIQKPLLPFPADKTPNNPIRNPFE